MKNKKRFAKLLMLIAITSGYGQQGNYNFEFYGNKSILLTGNVTGSVEDLGLAYYNPSRLIMLKDKSFSINAKAYQYDKITLNNIIVDGTNFNQNKFRGVPTMVAGVFKLFKQKFAYSFITKSNNNIDLSYTTKDITEDVLTQFPGDESYKGNIDLNFRNDDELIGLTWAKSINDKLSFGATIFYTVFSESSNSSLDYTIIHSTDLVANIKNNVGYELKSMGVLFKIGSNYQFKKADIGVTMTIPYIALVNDAKFTYNKTVSGIGSGSDVFDNETFNNLSANKNTPFSIAIGSGIQIGKNKLHLNVQWYSDVKQYNRIIIPKIQEGTANEVNLKFIEKLKSIINFGLGTEIYITPKATAYLSYSTDYSAINKNANIFDLNQSINNNRKDITIRQNYNHFGGGFDIKTNIGNIVFGSTYTRSQSVFQKPSSVDSNIDNNNSSIKVEQWRFIIGIEIPLLEKKLKSIIK